MNTYIISASVVLQIEAVDQQTAIQLAEEAIKRARFTVSHKLIRVHEIKPAESELHNESA